MRTCSCYLLLLLAAFATAICAAAADTNPSDEWTPIPSADGTPFIQDLGRRAMEQLHTVLGFSKVESARYQDADGAGGRTERNYELIIDASRRAGEGDGKYRAVVHVVKRIEPEALLSFEAIRPPPAN
ncbi:hypothetical protein ACP70R_020578 [Stipagrostis hirtigluma subsp. patula]